MWRGERNIVHFITKYKSLELKRDYNLLNKETVNPEERMRELLFRNENHMEISRMIKNMWELRRDLLNVQKINPFQHDQVTVPSLNPSLYGRVTVPSKNPSPNGQVTVPGLNPSPYGQASELRNTYAWHILDHSA